MPSVPSGPGGRRPGRTTRRSVILTDLAAGVIIRGGGLFVLVAVLGICIFLFAVFLPLFGTPEVDLLSEYRLPRGAKDLLFAELNEYGSIGAALYRDGTFSVFDARTGTAIREERITPEGAPIRSFSRSPITGHVALGIDGGSLGLGKITFDARFLEDDPAGIPGLSGGAATAPHEGGLVERTPLGQLRLSEVRFELDEPLPGEGGEIALVDYRSLNSREVVAFLRSDGKLFFARVTRKQNILEGKSVAKLKRFEVPYEPPMAGGPGPTSGEPAAPTRLLLSAYGDQLYLGWSDGTLHRYDLRSPEAPVLAEKADVCPEGVQLSSLSFMPGEQSIIAGDSSGACTAWFRIPAEGSNTADGYRMTPVHRLEPQRSAILEIAPSARDKTFATGTWRRGIWVRHMTSNRVLARLDPETRRAGGEISTAGSAPPQGGPGGVIYRGAGAALAEEPTASVNRAGAPVVSLQILPKSDGLFAVLADGQAFRWRLDNPHPETTPATIFGKVWYEGHEVPVHSWQSSSGTDDFEPKLGLAPLIFGTLKATTYALLFAVPIAILAAIFTSEFLGRRARGIVKPGIEMMASLPSVVLGFIAALVLAPWAEDWVTSLLIIFFVVPCAVLAASYFWLFLPSSFARRLDGFPKLFITVGVFLLAVRASFPLGRAVEAFFFGGDFRSWLSPPYTGTGTAVWAAALFPVSLASVLIARSRWKRSRPVSEPTARKGVADAAAQAMRGICVLAGSALASVAGGWALTRLGFDPRDSIIGTYVQRNTLIVGFAMGFAVIPIIYTLAEDALSAVPDHLRGASLGCGATQWQTATMVVLPTAMSGIFSAVMVGLGRAVGETMIVVMAAGNTPIMDINPFNGLRALSATIAVELPEAVKDGTLYRMLFLAGATLFVMTFVVNTVAEVVRLRFRKRAFEL